MAEQNPESADINRSRPTWIEWSANVVTVVASGVFLNVLTDYTGLRGVAVSSAAAGGLAAAAWLRRRPRAPLTRYSIRIALGLALLAALVAAAAPSGVAGF